MASVSAKPWWVYLIECGVVLLAAELSYRFIETPFRKGAFGAFLQQVASSSFSLSTYVRSRIVPVACAAVLVLGALGGLVFVPSTSALSEEARRSSRVHPTPLPMTGTDQATLRAQTPLPRAKVKSKSPLRMRTVSRQMPTTCS